MLTIKKLFIYLLTFLLMFTDPSLANAKPHQPDKLSYTQGISSATGAGAVVSGTIAATLAVYSGLYGMCNSWGRGIKLIINPITTLPVCPSQ